MKKGKMARKRKKIKNLQLEDMKLSFRFILVVVIIILIILLFLDLLINVPEPVRVEETGKSEPPRFQSFFSLADSTRVKMRLPAVNEEGRGVSTVLVVEATPGSGRTLTDIDNLLFWADTQHSIRIARRVAENITGKKMDDYDILYSIEANASLIGGPSAGSALAIATIAALEGKKLRKDVMITGRVNHDGSIGPVSAILEKARASRDVGATILLVPLLQSRDVVYETEEHCEVFGHAQICTTETKPVKIGVEEESGISIVEVESIQDAMLYFFE